jgi:hypothetical protein
MQALEGSHLSKSSAAQIDFSEKQFPNALALIRQTPKEQISARRQIHLS